MVQMVTRLQGKKNRGFRAAAEHVQPLACAPGNRHRMEKAIPAPRFLPADGMAVLKS
jgi:hypothetical protein